MDVSLDLQSLDGTDAVSGGDELEDVIDRSGELSMSPRDKLSYRSDKKVAKAMLKFIQDPTLRRLVDHLQRELLVQKPDDILDFVCDVFFSADNMVLLRSTFGMK